MSGRRPEWDGDAVHNACRAWLEGWRQTHGGTGPAPWSLVGEVGATARRLSGEGVGRVELARLMWAAGREGKPDPAAPDGVDPAA